MKFFIFAFAIIVFGGSCKQKDEPGNSEKKPQDNPTSAKQVPLSTDQSSLQNVGRTEEQIEQGPYHDEMKHHKFAVFEQAQHEKSKVPYWVAIDNALIPWLDKKYSRFEIWTEELKSADSLNQIKILKPLICKMGLRHYQIRFFPAPENLEAPVFQVDLTWADWRDKATQEKLIRILPDARKPSPEGPQHILVVNFTPFIAQPDDYYIQPADHFLANKIDSLRVGAFEPQTLNAIKDLVGTFKFSEFNSGPLHQLIFLKHHGMLSEAQLQDFAHRLREGPSGEQFKQVISELAHVIDFSQLTEDTDNPPEDMLQDFARAESPNCTAFSYKLAYELINTKESGNTRF